MKDNIYSKIEKLKKYKNADFPVLSVYLGNAGKKTPNQDIIKSQFHSLINKSLDKNEKKNFKKEIGIIDSYLREKYDSRGKRSIVFFIGKNLKEVLELEFYLNPECKVGNSPYLYPLINELKIYERYLVILADRKKAYMFTVHMGQIEDYMEIYDDSVPQKVRVDEEHFYGRSDKVFRHIEDHLRRHIDLMLQSATGFIKDKKISFIILGGHSELLEKIKKRMPSNYRKMILGKFITELNIPLNKLFLKSKQIADTIEKDKQYRKLEESLAPISPIA